MKQNISAKNNRLYDNTNNDNSSPATPWLTHHSWVVTSLHYDNTYQWTIWISLEYLTRMLYPYVRIKSLKQPSIAWVVKIVVEGWVWHSSLVCVILDQEMVNTNHEFAFQTEIICWIYSRSYAAIYMSHCIMLSSFLWIIVCRAFECLYPL